MEIMDKKEQVLKVVENIGKKVKERTDPCYWSFEDHRKVNYELKTLELLRKIYKEIRDSDNWNQIKQVCKKYEHSIPGIEGNKFNKFIKGILL